MKNKYFKASLTILVLMAITSYGYNLNFCKNENILLEVIYYYKKHISGHVSFIKCKYDMSCSNYAIVSIKKYGAMKGGYLAFKRMNSCY